MADKIYRMILKESDGTPETGLLVRARSLATNTTYTMTEVPGASGAGKYITASLLPNGAYLLEKSTNGGTTWGPINPSDPDLNIVTVEPGTFRQTDSTLQSDTQRVLRGEIRAASFVPVGVEPNSTHINAAIASIAGGAYSRVVLGNVNGYGAWRVTSTIALPIGCTLDLAGCLLFDGTGLGSNPMLTMNSNSRIEGGTVADQRTNATAISVLNATSNVQIAAVIQSNNAADKFTTPIISVPNGTAAPVVLGSQNANSLDPATDNPYGDTGLSSNPMAVSKWPIVLSSSSVAAAKVRPGDLQAFFYRAMSSEANKGADFDYTTLDDNTLNNGEKLGRALRQMLRVRVINASLFEFWNGTSWMSAGSIGGGGVTGNIRLSGAPGLIKAEVNLYNAGGLMQTNNADTSFSFARILATNLPSLYQGRTFLGTCCRVNGSYTTGNFTATPVRFSTDSGNPAYMNLSIFVTTGNMSALTGTLIS